MSPNESACPGIFVLHGTKDHAFAVDLIYQLRRNGYGASFEDCEIASEESIATNVFDSLRPSDIVIAVVSSASVASKWIREGLNAEILQRIQSARSRILPVLIEDCILPPPLGHARSVDFRESREEGMSTLLEALNPGHILAQSLIHLQEHFLLVSERLSRRDLNAAAVADINTIHDLLDTAFNLRTEIELRRTRRGMDDRAFFHRLSQADPAIDLKVRKDTWEALGTFRSALAHTLRNRQMHLDLYADIIRENQSVGDTRQGLVKCLDTLTHVLRRVCTENWELTVVPPTEQS